MLIFLPLYFLFLLLVISGRHAIFQQNNGAAFLFMVVPIFLFGLYYVGFRPLDAGYDTWNYVRTYEALKGIGSARQVGAYVYGNTEYLFWPIQSILSPILEPQA